MSQSLEQLFGTRKPLIAMVHVPPLPGTPLYDARAGVGGLISAVQRDLELLLAAGFDGYLFCNEGDRPYELRAGPEAAAVMSRVVTECAPRDRTFGVDFLWDARCALAVAVATGAGFMREVLTGRVGVGHGPVAGRGGARAARAPASRCRPADDHDEHHARVRLADRAAQPGARRRARRSSRAWPT